MSLYDKVWEKAKVRCEDLNDLDNYAFLEYISDALENVDAVNTTPQTKESK